MCEVQRRSAEAPRWECAWHSRGAQGTRGPEQNEKFLGPRTEFLRFLGLKVVCRHLSLGVVSSQRRHLLETGLCRRFPHMLSCPEPQSCLGLDCYSSRRAGKRRPCFFGIWLLGNLCPPQDHFVHVCGEHRVGALPAPCELPQRQDRGEVAASLVSWFSPWLQKLFQDSSRSCLRWCWQAPDLVHVGIP